MSMNLKLDEKKIYNDYRSSIRLMRNSEGKFGRTADRKQRALKFVANKNKIRIREVKDIVRAFDQVNGISHEHPAPYMKRVQFLEDARKIEDANSGNKICPLCEREIDEDTGVELRVRVNPYEVEIYDILRPLYSCYDCYLEVEEDV